MKIKTRINKNNENGVAHLISMLEFLASQSFTNLVQLLKQMGFTYTSNYKSNTEVKNTFHHGHDCVIGMINISGDC